MVSCYTMLTQTIALQSAIYYDCLDKPYTLERGPGAIEAQCSFQFHIARVCV